MEKKNGGTAAAKDKSPFFKEVYAIVAAIPPGKVATYGQIAALVGKPRSAKIVGFAMSKAPSGLPCHRVVNRLGQMAPRDVFGSGDFQKQLLLDEGISFLPGGNIDLAQHLWQPPDSY